MRLFRSSAVLRANRLAWLTALYLSAIGAASAAEDGISFSGKRITMTIGNSAGGSTDLFGRAYGRYLAEYLPGRPVMVTVNQPGAEGVTSLNSWVVRAPRDGSNIAIGAGTQINPFYYRSAHAKYDTNTLEFVGGVSAPGGALFVNKDAVKRLYDRSLPPVVMGALSAIRSNMYMSVWGTEFLGWNTRWVVGYPDTKSLVVALQRGEIDMSAFGSLPEIQSLLNSGEFAVVAQEGRLENGQWVPRPVIGNAPIMAKLVAGKITDPRAQQAFAYWERISQVGQWIALPPDTPEEIVAVHQRATIATFNDIEYRKHAAAIVTDGVAMSAADVKTLARELDRTPDAVFGYLNQIQAKIGFTKGKGN